MLSAPEFEVISVKEIRYDLAEFFRQVAAGRKFVVYLRSKAIAKVAKAGDLEEAGVLRLGAKQLDSVHQASVILDVATDAMLERKAFRP